MTLGPMQQQDMKQSFPPEKPKLCEQEEVTEATTTEASDVEVGIKMGSAVKASNLARKQSKKAGRKQTLIAIAVALLYSMVGLQGLLILLRLWLGEGAGSGGSLGFLFGVFYGLMLLYTALRVTGISMGLKGRLTNEQEAAAAAHRDLAIAVVPRDDTPAANNEEEEPQLFYRLPEPEEIALHEKWMWKYGSCLFGVGIVPLLAVMSWPAAGVGCLFGYAYGILYYPVSLWTTAKIMKQDPYWFYREPVQLALKPTKQEEPQLPLIPAKVVAVVEMVPHKS